MRSALSGEHVCGIDSEREVRALVDKLAVRVGGARD